MLGMYGVGFRVGSRVGSSKDRLGESAGESRLVRQKVGFHVVSFVVAIEGVSICGRGGCFLKLIL